MFRRYAPRLALTLLTVFFLDLTDLIELHKNAANFKLELDNDFSRMFSELLFGFHRIDTGLNASDIAQLAFLAAAPLFLGQSISADLSISGTYYFTRQNHRTRWYVRRSLSLLACSLTVSIFTCLLNAAMTSYFDVNGIPAARIALVMLSVTMCIFVLVMLSNIIGIFFGSVIGLAVTVVYAGANILLTYSPLRQISLVFNSAFLPDEGYADMSVKLGVNTGIAAAVFAAGLVVVRKRELGLVNAEQLF